jgi:acyl dehydratase
MDDVIGHGMLSMSLLSRYLLMHFPVTRLRDFEVKFEGMTLVGDELHCSAVFEKEENELAVYALIVRASDRRILSGSCKVAVR